MKQSAAAFLLITDSLELNGALSRYLQNRYNLYMQTIRWPLDLVHFSKDNILKGHNLIAVQNEVLIDDALYGIYPLWFNWGLKNNRRVYCITYEKTDISSNIINWRDFLDTSFCESFQHTVNNSKVPHFNVTRGILYGLLRPHSGDSLFDLSSKLHTTCGNISRKFEKKEITAELFEKVLSTLITPGHLIFLEFQRKEKKYHKFLSFLPEGPKLFMWIEVIETLFSKLIHLKNVLKEKSLRVIEIIKKLERKVIQLYSFFENLEIFVKGDIV